ncbi:MAG: DUF58 domain-containing protein [Candidatus Bipolaricaulia bacterium]
MEKLIDEAFLQRLANLRFMTAGRQGGRLSGSHASPRAGVSIEFADYREYVPGDDFRYVDWNIYGRLGRLLVKTFVQEADLPINLVIDSSASMQLGSPSKSRYAARLALALGYLGLRSLDRVGLFPFSDRLLDSVPPRHGMRQLSRLLKVLTEIEPSGNTAFDHAVTELQSVRRENGLVILIGDLLDAEGLESGIGRLLHRGDEVVVIQVLDPEEVEPSGTGYTQIVDVESGRRVTMNLGRRSLAQYRQRFQAHQSRLSAFLLERRIPYFVAPTDRRLEQLIFEDLRIGGILR